MSIATRLARLEKQLAGAATERWAYSHPQLVRMATYQATHGRAPEDWTTVVGPPAHRLEPGELSHEELIHMTANFGAFGVTPLPTFKE